RGAVAGGRGLGGNRLRGDAEGGEQGRSHLLLDDGAADAAEVVAPGVEVPGGVKLDVLAALRGVVGASAACHRLLVTGPAAGGVEQRSEPLLRREHRP